MIPILTANENCLGTTQTAHARDMAAIIFLFRCGI